MGKTYEQIDEKIESWMARQQMFFVATAPVGADTLVNCSPKGTDTLRVLGPTTLAYMDGDGSGIETIAHVKENGRIVIMMCAFAGPPKIYRFHGQGVVIESHHAEFENLRAEFPAGNCRAIIRIALTRVSDSCGYGVPNYEYTGERPSHSNMMKSIKPEQLDGFREMNAFSLDGLPGLERQKK
ncbi:MAG: pyridoxamine 5'-phosphate oxidase family protein [Alphaproteobacteria bacterium]